MPVFQASTRPSANVVNRLLELSASGTVSITSGSPTVTGSSTNFVNEVQAGDKVIINSVEYTVLSISNATSLTLSTNAQNTASSQTMFVTPGSGKFGVGISYIQASPSNTADVWFGDSRNSTKDGADITTSNRVWRLSPGAISPALSIGDLNSVYKLSDNATPQIINVLAN
jgi:hypothetical protein